MYIIYVYTQLVRRKQCHVHLNRVQYIFDVAKYIANLKWYNNSTLSYQPLYQLS